METNELNDTEKRVLKNLHLLGYTGKMGSMKRGERLKLLQGLVKRGYLTEKGQVTEKGINVNLLCPV